MNFGIVPFFWEHFKRRKLQDHLYQNYYQYLLHRNNNLCIFPRNKKRFDLFRQTMTDKVDRNHIKGFLEKKCFQILSAANYLIQFQYLLKTKSQRDLPYHKRADTKCVYRFITFFSWCQTYLITNTGGYRLLLNNHGFEKPGYPFRENRHIKTVKDTISSDITYRHPMERCITLKFKRELL